MENTDLLRDCKQDAKLAKAIAADGAKSFTEFVETRTERDMLRVPNLGRKSVDKIKAIAAEKGLRIAEATWEGPRSPEPVRQKWEYRFLNFPREMPLTTALALLNDFGAKGWELQGTMTNARLRERALLLKRPAK